MTIGDVKSGWIHVCDLEPECDGAGAVVEYFPQREYAGRDRAQLHQYGNGPFCRFRIPGGYEKKKGVFAIRVEDEVQYVGECLDLARLFNSHIGRISPSSCFAGGQRTNCRINAETLREVKAGRRVSLFFRETKERIKEKNLLIQRYQPAWNRTAGKYLKNRG